MPALCACEKNQFGGDSSLDEERSFFPKRETRACYAEGYQNIPVNLDEALRQIGGYLYGVQHHERAQRVTHSLEALDEGSGTEVRAEGR